jgi:hypothetical protein
MKWVNADRHTESKYENLRYGYVWIHKKIQYFATWSKQ